MQFNIEVISVSEVKGKKNNRGGLFNAVEVVYKREGKVEAKSFPDWANIELYPTLLALKVGDSKTVTTEKVEGFWRWLALSEVSLEEQKVEATTTAVKNTGGKVIGSNYETPEERARRQVMIVRQSSISNAIAFAELVGTKPNVDKLLDVAREFESFVHNTETEAKVTP